MRLTDPRDDKTRIKQIKGGLLKDSYKWILDHPDFRRWRDDDQSRLLWIKGDPGKGKTMLLIGIIEELEKQKESAPDAGLLSFFLCQSTDSRLNNATAGLRGLIYLLLDQQPSLISHLRKKYDHAGQRLFEDANTLYALSEIFRDMLRDPSLRGTYLIIDALDECQKELPQLLDLIVQNSSAPSTHVKWIVSSRNNRPDIERRLRPDDACVRLSLELNSQHVSDAVDVYIDQKTSELTSITHDKALRDQARDRMRRKANKTFLWVSLVVKELQDLEDVEYEESWDVLQVLEEVPSDLIPLYDRMIEQIRQLKNRDPEFCRLVLSTVTLAYRPLHLLELPIMAGLKGQLLHNTKVQRIVNKCGSFLTIQEDHVYLIHQSAKDYLNTNASAVIFLSRPAEVHYDVFSRSLQVMSETLRRDIYNLRHPGISIDQVKPDCLDSLTPLRYSCVYWADHLCDHLCEVDSSSLEYQSGLRDSGIVHLFLQKNFLYWLEALSLMRSMSDGVLAVVKLESLLRVSLHFISITLLKSNSNELGSSRLNLNCST